MPVPSDDQLRRVEAVLDMGLDDTLLLKPPGPREDDLVRDEWMAPVTARVWTEVGDDGTSSVLVKEYLTPEGPLRQSVRLSQERPFGNDIALLSDMNVIQGAEYLVKAKGDLPRLRHVLRDPTAHQIREFREDARRIRQFARTKGVLVEGGWMTIVDAAVWLFGLDRLIVQAVEDPGFVSELLELIFGWERPRLELLLDEHVDLVVHSGWYEMPHFWSPRLYREIIKPVLAEEAKLIHGAGVPFCYTLTAGSSLVLDDLVGIGVDMIRGVDPVQGHGDNLALIMEFPALW